jgi:hypothetical protein
MKDALIAERKALIEQIERINERQREIAVALGEIERAEYKAETAKKIATATHTAVRVSESNRRDPYIKTERCLRSPMILPGQKINERAYHTTCGTFI